MAKNKALLALVIVCCSFAAFLAGIFIGRNTSGSDVILTKMPGAVAPTAPEATKSPSANYPININTADSELLQQLPGIGAVLAERIITYRTENGPFETVSQLTMVPGIGPDRLEGLKDYATTGG